MHKDKRAEKITGRGPDGKAIVAAVLELGGKVRATVVKNRRRRRYKRWCAITLNLALTSTAMH